MPETSVIIRAFNEAEYIGDVLEAVESQEYQDFEIILVDSGSTDGTLEIAEEYVDTIEFVSPQNFTFGYSCNVGCEAASGKYCAFLSAHAIPTSDQWLGTMVENLSEDEVAMTYSNQVGAETTKHSERRVFNELFPDESRRQTPPDYWANNASSVIKKNLWEEHQFDEYLTGHEDIEWAKHFMDQGYVVIYEADSCIYHIHNESWEQVFNRFEREAIADVEIGIKKPSHRWKEYLQLPTDILVDILTTIRDKKFGIETIREIIRFRYSQHIGTVSGLLSEPNLEDNRYSYYYNDINKSVYKNFEGGISIKQHQLPDIKPNDVLIKSNYVGVVPNIDEPNDKNKYPIVPHGNYVGTVVEIGANVTSISVGETVVGETRFRCGICRACSNNETRCEDPIKLGIDTEFGAYSQFFTAPSDHLYPLPDNITAKEGAFAQTVAHIKENVDKIESLTGGFGKCLVIGDSARTNIVIDLLKQTGRYDIDRIVPEPADNTLSDTNINRYDIIIETTGRISFTQVSMNQSKPDVIILLLGGEYNNLQLDEQRISQKTIIRSQESGNSSVKEGVKMLSELNTNRLLNGTYKIEEFEKTNNIAKQGDCIPIIEFDPN